MTGEGPPPAEVVRLVGEQRRRDDWSGHRAWSTERGKRMDQKEAGRDPHQQALLYKAGDHVPGLGAQELPQLADGDRLLRSRSHAARSPVSMADIAAPL